MSQNCLRPLDFVQDVDSKDGFQLSSAVFHSPSQDGLLAFDNKLCEERNRKIALYIKFAS